MIKFFYETQKLMKLEKYYPEIFKREVSNFLLAFLEINLDDNDRDLTWISNFIAIVYHENNPNAGWNNFSSMLQID